MSYANLIEALEVTEPARLAALRSQFDQNRLLFSSARHLGEPEPLVAPVSAGPLPAMLKLATLGVEAMSKRIQDLLSLVLRRMRLASRIKLGGAIAATASGLVGAILAFSQQAKGVGELSTACFSFIGGLVTILADRVIRSPSGLPIASPEEHAKILSMRLDAERIALRLARVDVSPLSSDEARKMLDQLDEQAVQMIRYQGS